MRDHSGALLAELATLVDRLAAALRSLRAFRATRAGQLAVGDARLDLAALQRLADETDRLTSTGAKVAVDAAALAGQLRP